MFFGHGGQDDVRNVLPVDGHILGILVGVNADCPHITFPAFRNGFKNACACTACNLEQDVGVLAYGAVGKLFGLGNIRAVADEGGDDLDVVPGSFRPSR